MVELLGTYTSENASAAREDAQRCILAALADPKTFLLDPLLALKPVRFLEGELIHDLLLIFVQEKLPAYLQFYKDHREFVENNLGKEKPYSPQSFHFHNGNISPQVWTTSKTWRRWGSWLSCSSPKRTLKCPFRWSRRSSWLRRTKSKVSLSMVGELLYFDFTSSGSMMINFKSMTVFCGISMTRLLCFSVEDETRARSHGPGESPSIDIEHDAQNFWKGPVDATERIVGCLEDEPYKCSGRHEGSSFRKTQVRRCSLSSFSHAILSISCNNSI